MDRYVSFEGFIYDAARHALSHEGKHVPLAPRALDILALLLEHAGEIVGKDQILESLWPGEYVQESTLAQHVYLLRRALGDAGEGFVQTVPRRGYRFVGEIRSADALPARGRLGRIPAHALPARFARAALAFVVLAGVLAIGFAERRDHGQRVVAALDPRAERAYVLGRYYWNKRNYQDLVRSLRQFEIVIRYSPNNAAGYSGAADSHLQLVDLTTGREHEEHLQLGERYALRAIQLDPDSAAAHATLGFHLAFDRHDVAGARREFARSIALDPSYASAYQWSGILEMQEGAFDKAIAELRQGAVLEPTSLPIARWLGFAYYYAHRYDDALAQLHQALELQPNDGDTLIHVAFVHIQQHRVREGLAILRHLPADQFDRAELIALRAYADALDGRPTVALRSIDALERSSLRDDIGGAAIAAVYATLGRNSEALAAMRRSRLKWDESSICPRQDPRLAALYGAMKSAYLE